MVDHGLTMAGNWHHCQTMVYHGQTIVISLQIMVSDHGLTMIYHGLTHGLTWFGNDHFAGGGTIIFKNIL